MTITNHKFNLISILVLLTSIAWLNPVSAKQYKGAEIFTAEAELYGKFVIRMRAAKASGVISNFFLWKDGSEMDSIFWEEVDVEVFGKENAMSWQSNIISGLGNKSYSEQVHRGNQSFADAYHTFTLEWTPNQVRWLVDGVVARTSSGGQASELTSAAQIRLNFWPPDNPAWVGSWSDSVLPLYMYVNWVEFHSYNNGQFNLEWRDDFDYFDNGRWGKADWTFAENRADFSPENAVVKNGYLVLAMTREGQEGYNGNPPQDNQPASSSSVPSSSAPSSSSSMSSSSVSSVRSSSSSSTAISSSSSSTSSSAPTNPAPRAGSINLWMCFGLLTLLALLKMGFLGRGKAL